LHCSAVRRAAQVAAAVCVLLPGMLAAQTSSDATLKELTLDDDGADVAISPAFDPDVTDYTAQVESGVRGVTVTATPTDGGATVASDPADSDPDADGIQVPLTIGENSIDITVTAADGSERVYRITVTRVPYCTADTAAVTAVTDTPSTGLVSDCNILLDAKEILESPDGLSLNWSTERDMRRWTAIEISGNRVTKLDSEMDDEQTIFSNTLQGELPATLGGLSALTVLRFNNTALRGEIPEQLGDLSELTMLDLASNRDDLLAFGGGFEGSIPASLGNLQRLEVLNLNHNLLIGGIPDEFRSLTALRVLDLGGNVDIDVFQRPVLPATGLEGEIPIDVLVELRSLEALDLSFNRLTGDIPRELARLELDELHLHRNFLVGCIPASLGRFRDLGHRQGINPQRNTNNYLLRDLPLCPAPDRPSVRIAWARGGEMVVAYSTVDNGREPVSRYEYRLSADGGATWSPDWTAIPDSAPGGANADSYKLTGLTDGTEYTVELRAVNDDGAGPAASVTGTPESYPETALRGLTIRHGTTDLVLSPDFAFDGFNYTAMVGTSVAVVTIVATPADDAATVTSDPEDDDGAEGIQVALDSGVNTIVLTVTAENGEQDVYRLAIVRNPTDDPAGVNAQPTELSLAEGSMASYTLVLAAEPAAEVTLAVRVNGSRSVKAGPSRLTFSSTDWDVPQTVTVRAATDADDANERATLIHVATGAGYETVSMPTVAVTASDDNDAWKPNYLRIEARDGNLVLVYDRRLDESSVPAPGDFEVTVNDEVLDVESVAVSGTRVTLTLERAVVSGSVSIAYTPGANPIRGVPEIGGSARTARVLLFESASNDDRQGFVRVINHSDGAGEVRILAIDDAGVQAGPVSLAIAAGAVAPFNAEDLEQGKANKGLPDGIGPASFGDWRLELTSDLDIEVLSYARTMDGFVTSLHDAVPEESGEHRVVFFNPGDNVDQVSRLRLVNPNAESVSATITGTDDEGESSGEVSVTIPAEGAVVLTADELEQGTGRGIEEGSLGIGKGKWRLSVVSQSPITAMSLLESQGRLTNLSTAPQTPGDQEGSVVIPLFPSVSDQDLEGFVRVINHSAESGEVDIDAFDDTDHVYETVTLSLDAGEAQQFNSDDLEVGNTDKGLTGSTGAGEGDWRLRFASDLDIEILAYIRTEDGFVTAMHDLAPVADGEHRVVFLNPASNTMQVSRIRLVNPGTTDAAVTITGVDDDGVSPGNPVQATVPAGDSLELNSTELESGGGDGIVSGALGDGKGKWRLGIESDQAILVMSLLESPTRHLTNLSTSPDRDADE